MHDYDKLYIGGQWGAPAGSATIDVISPHTAERVGRTPEGTTADIDRAGEAARKAFDEGDWPRLSLEDRVAAVQKISDVYAARMTDMAAVITAEMGSSDSVAQRAQAPAPWMMLNPFAGLAAARPIEEARTGMLGTDVIVRGEGVG